MQNRLFTWLIACSRDWSNCGSLAAVVHPSIWHTTISYHPCYLSGCNIKFLIWSDLTLKKKSESESNFVSNAPWFPTQHCYLKVPMLRPFVLLVKGTCTWRVRSIGGMTITGYKRNTRRNPCSTATLSTTNLTRTGLGSNPGLHP